VERGREVIGITLGDPAGIGPEIVLKSLSYFRGAPILLIGSQSALDRTAKKLSLRLASGILRHDTGEDFEFRFGQAQRKCGAAALSALETAVLMLRQGKLKGVVTAPVSKEVLRLAGFEFPGQTEFLARRLGAKRYAMLAYAEAGDRRYAIGDRRCKSSSGYRIVFVTIHKPLAEVPKAITAKLVAEKICLLSDFLRRQEGIARPRIAVLALNPHGREFTLGEEARIAQGIRAAHTTGVEGPFPADTIGQLLTRYDGLVAMYHDQAMIPAKLLARGRGVNLTLGLPKVRTSPLHGTAFDIAGKGIASADSMIAAIKVALRLAAGSE
jgi:4-hydroxythreonine-4-phosphate dehydrogenase